jgi:CRISPR-associated endonuclease/helicase Cas3
MPFLHESQASAPNLHLVLWGKADPKHTISTDGAIVGPAWHPLVFHMLDCVAVAQHILMEVRPMRLQAAARTLSLDEDITLPWMLLFVALHDLGKATPAFQHKADGHVARLSSLGFDFPDSNEPHGSLSSVLVDAALAGVGVARPLARLVAKTVGAHHGDYATDSTVSSVRDVKRHLGKSRCWTDARAALVHDLASILRVPPTAPPQPTASAAALHAFAADLAGLTTTADWVGSNAEVFRYSTATISISDYWAHAKELARDAVRKTGFRSAPRGMGRRFGQLFANPPWPLHQALEKALPDVRPGALVVVEAPMGEGKTEAALLVFEAMSQLGADGLFFALPTQATANQILRRVGRFLRENFEGVQGLHLVHGGAALSEQYAELKHKAFRAQSVGGVEGKTLDGPVADAWFAKPKRALLAPVGVGTVDQALLAVLRSRHHFLRLHGLAGKVFVVDEVHAYDVFTSTILARLCEWLAALGATVVLLSATLATAQRERLVRAFGAQPGQVPPYPRITIAQKGVCGAAATLHSHTFESRRPPTLLRIAWKPADQLMQEVVNAAQAGANVAWIVNTVSRAQALFLALQNRLEAVDARDTPLFLLHARLPASDRLAREQALSTQYGPPGTATTRPNGSILVGTQVLEQSLDFDFDAMVTELAPVDLVLQRAGRLQRHDRAARPPGCEQPLLWIEQPNEHASAAGPTFGAATFVYEEAVLLRSFLTLQANDSVKLPDDLERLVAEVYDEQVPQTIDPLVSARLQKLHAEAAESERANETNARSRVLPSPSDDAPFSDFSCHFDEDDPRIHHELRATTRLGDSSVSVVGVMPVAGNPSRLALATSPNITFLPDASEVPLDVTMALSKSAISVSRRNLVRALLSEHPRAFERSGFLRHHRLLRLDEHLRANINGTPICLHPELGLVVGALVEQLPVLDVTAPTTMPTEGETHVG